MNRRMGLCGAAAGALTAITAVTVSAQVYPISASGWNRDIVVERTATAPYSNFAMSFDTFNNIAWYENGLPGGTKGLPQNHLFASASDATVTGLLQPYDMPNALFMDFNTPTNTLNIDPASQQRYDALAVFASSSNSSAGGIGTMVINFTDSSSSSSISFNAQDWFNITTNNALNNLGRLGLAGTTTDDGSSGNPRLYYTLVDMVALGLNDRNVASITFTKPIVSDVNQATVVMGVSGRRAATLLLPLNASGWNRDIIVEATATAPYSSAASDFDVTNHYAWYESGLSGSTKGLPAGGAFVSVSNPAVHGQFQPYSGLNALFLNATQTSTTGTLTLDPGAQVPYEFLAVFASSNTSGTGTMVINFTDGSSTGNLGFNAQDWFNTTTVNALNNLGRARTTATTPLIDDASAGNPRMYQTIVDLGALGFDNRAVQSITFTKPTASTSTAIFAISGQAASNEPGACCATTGTCTLQALTNCLAPNLFQGAASACSGAACPTTVSACCNTTTGVCLCTTGTICPSGSANQGAGSICSPTPCPQAGACCANTGQCSQTSAAGCATPSLFQGLGVACTPGNFCATATGACCNPLFANCVFVAGSNCPTGYIFSGAGTACSPNGCVGLPSICDNLDSTAVGSLPTGWSSTVATGTGAPWAVTSAQSHSSPNSVSTNDVASISDQQLVLATVMAGGSLTLDFWSSFITEGTYTGGSWFDGWVVESSTDGVTFTNIGAAAWTLNGYNATAISTCCGNPLMGQPAFSGSAPTWTEHTAVISANPGDQVTIRFRMASDSSVSPANSGVWIDDICIANIQAPASGVCCRGSTCNTTVAQADCAGSGRAGAAFVSASSTCNSGVVSNTPCCYGDYNKINGITVQDIFDFLADWFAGSPYAKVGSDGATTGVTVQNIFSFLSNWFAGGC